MMEVNQSASSSVERSRQSSASKKYQVLEKYKKTIEAHSQEKKRRQALANKDLEPVEEAKMTGEGSSLDEKDKTVEVRNDSYIDESQQIIRAFSATQNSSFMSPGKEGGGEQKKNTGRKTKVERSKVKKGGL